jgi:hypothetical protein
MARVSDGRGHARSSGVAALPHRGRGVNGACGTAPHTVRRARRSQKRVVSDTRTARGEPGVMFVLLCAEA